MAAGPRSTLLGILLGVFENTLFSSVIMGGALGFPIGANACIGVRAGAKLCKYWRDGQLQRRTGSGVHSGAEAECRLVATGVHSALPRHVEVRRDHL